jgi:ABC-2 type transport system permease protein
VSARARKWREIVRFELVYQLRRKSTWLFFTLFMFPLIGVTTENLRNSSSDDILFNAPLPIAESSVIWSLVALLVLAAFAGDAATRDVSTRMEPLLRAAPIDGWACVGGRFLGVFLLAAMWLLIVPAVRIYAGLVHWGLEASDVGPFAWTPHVQSYFLLILPNVFVSTALMFALAALVRHALAAYVAAALLFIATQGAVFVADTLGQWQLGSLLDPAGVAAIEWITATWSPIEVNEKSVSFEGALLLNRVLWLASACAALVLTVRRYAVAGDVGALRWWQRRRLPVTHPVASDADRVSVRAGADLAGASVALERAASAPPVPRAFGAAARLRQTLAITRDSLRAMLTVWTWLLVPVFLIRVMATIDAIEGMGAGTMVLPTTDRILAPIETDAPPLALAILMFPVLLAGHLVWRERDANLDGLIDSTPVPSGIRFVGKLLALWLVMIALHVLLIVAGVVAQVSLGWYDLEPALYLKLVALRLVDPLVYALFAMCVHVLVNQKHVGHILVLALILAPRILAAQLGLEHPLVLLGSEPNWRYSPISGFGPFVAPVLWFELYWAAWAVLFAIVARLFWVRGAERGLGERLRVARGRLRGRTAGALVVALALVAAVGGYIFYNTNVLNDYQTSAERTMRQVEYERQFRRYLSAPQPQLTAAFLNVELHPDRREAEIRGVHRLVNRTARPIDTVHVAVSYAGETGAMEFDRPARAALLADDLGHRAYVLGQPLQPGDALEMSWLVRHRPRGFPAGDISTAVVENGSFLTMSDWVPHVGYLPVRELSDANLRRQNGLPERPPIPSLYDLEARRQSPNRGFIDLDVTIGTAAGQTAIAPGVLQREWTEGGRRYFHYRTDAPVGQGYALFSADYAVRKARWRDVELEVAHHPAHTLNVDRMIRGMQASLEQLSARFGPYPYKTLRFVEYPGEGGSLHAASATIWYRELFSLFDPEHDYRRLDLPFAVTGHEVAHQWWGGQGALVEGVAFLGESLAWYSALGVVEQELGAEQLDRLLAFMRETYLRLRPRAGVPLLRAFDSVLAYREGPFAMYALREYIGADKVDAALQQFREHYTSTEPPFATTLDLYAELQAVTPESLQYLLADLFERNTFWELRATEASARQMPNGEWEVTFQVDARKVAVDELGVETPYEMNDLIEVGVYAPAEPERGETAGAEAGAGVPLYVAMHRIRTGPQTITITVPQRPARAGIDPRHLLIDVEPGDNFANVGP